MSPFRSSAGARVLAVGEDRELTLMMKSVLAEGGVDCQICHSVAGALTALKQDSADAILSGWQAGGGNGLELLRQLRAASLEAPVILLMTESEVDLAAAAMREGAFECVRRPFDPEHIRIIVARAVEMGSLKRENRRLLQRLHVTSAAAGFVAEGPSSRQLLATVRQVASSGSTVLIQGETGTGKGLLARLLHCWSRRSEGPFVAVDCKAFTGAVVEREPFGREQDSSTGAVATPTGCFARAKHGTLFLDEIAEAGPDFQAQLLRILEENEIMRVGRAEPRRIEVRIVAATNRILEVEVAAKRFRGDLYYGLNVIPVRIPPLRERPEDILPLARHFLAFHSTVANRPRSLTPEAERLLYSYRWPGNVRELQNAIERAVVLSGTDRLGPEAFALKATVPEQEYPNEPSNSTDGLQVILDRVAAARIREALAEVKGNRGQAAEILGIDRSTLYRLVKRLGI